MLHIRFTGLLYGVLFVLHAFKSCSVHAHQGGETVGERLVASEETSESVQKEFVVGFGGRKLGGHEVVAERKEIGGKQWLEVGASKNSGATANRSDGENNNAEIISIEKYQDHTNNQINGMNMFGSKTRAFAGSGIPRSYQPFHDLPNSMQFEDSKAVPPKASLESHRSMSDKPVTQEPPVSGNRVESKMLLEVSKEIVNLIHKDYKGCDRPGRKPPINNHVPSEVP